MTFPAEYALIAVFFVIGMVTYWLIRWLQRKDAQYAERHFREHGGK